MIIVLCGCNKKENFPNRIKKDSQQKFTLKKENLYGCWNLKTKNTYEDEMLLYSDTRKGKISFYENNTPLDNDVIELKNKIRTFCILLELPKIANEELYEKIKNVNIPKLSEINKPNLKMIIKATAKKLKTSGTIIMNIYEIIKGFDDFLFSNAQLEEKQTNILTSEKLRQKYNRINNLREEDFASLNHIDTFDIVLNIYESVLNNNFIRKIKYL